LPLLLGNFCLQQRQFHVTDYHPTFVVPSPAILIAVHEGAALTYEGSFEGNAEIEKRIRHFVDSINLVSIRMEKAFPYISC
jgi:hypothetical protein